MRKGETVPVKHMTQEELLRRQGKLPEQPRAPFRIDPQSLPPIPTGSVSGELIWQVIAAGDFSRGTGYVSSNRTLGDGERVSRGHEGKGEGK